MKVAYATLGGSPDRNDDRVFITDNTVIVMDGASAFVPCSVDTGTYVDILGAAIVNELQDQPADLRTAVRNAIATTVAELDLEPGESPSSTVSIVRIASETVDVFVLGDTPVMLGFTDGTHQRITDDRIHQIPTPARDAYRTRLAAGLDVTDVACRRTARLSTASYHIPHHQGSSLFGLRVTGRESKVIAYGKYRRHSSDSLLVRPNGTDSYRTND